MVISCCAVLGAAVPASIAATPASAGARKPSSVMPRGMLARGANGLAGASLRNTASPPPDLLAPFGGHVLQHVKLYAVLWGNGVGDTYLPEETAGSAPNMSDFLTSLAGSHSYLDWMSEYSTGTEFVGTGSFAGAYTITPAGGNDTTPLDDSQIMAELAAQVHAGNLPAPDANSLYVLMFRSGQEVTLGTSNSNTDFCAYHSSIEGANYFAGMGVLRYAVLPYNASNAGCGGSPGWNNFTATASHEIAESITDPDVGLAIEHENDDPNFLNYLGWYDLDDNLEIADLCQILDGTTGTVNGYSVVTLYSDEASITNPNDPCVTHGHIREFSVGDAKVLEGDSGTHTLWLPVTMSAPSNFDNSVNYSMSGLTATSGTSAAPGVDFLNKSGTVSFPAGTSQHYVAVTIEGDKTPEVNETFTVTLSAPSVGYELGRPQGTGTIINDDPPAAPLTVGIGDSSVAVGQAGNHVLAMAVTLSHNVTTPVKLKYTVTGVTAVLNTDFAGPTTGTFTIPANSREVTLNWTVKPDAALAVNKVLRVSIAGVSWPAGTKIVRATGTGTIMHV
jgi:hypothetical protein